MFQIALKRLFCPAVVAVAVLLSSAGTSQAGWHHWGGCASWGYGYQASYYAPVYYAPSYYSGGWRSPCVSAYTYYSPTVYPRYSCFRPWRRACVTPYYPSCCNTCYGYCTCSSCCGAAVGCCDSGTVVHKYSATPDEPTVAPQEPAEYAAPPRETPPAPAPIDSLPPAPVDTAPPTADEPSSILPDPGAAPDVDLPELPSLPAAPPLPSDARNRSDMDSAVLSVVVPDDARVYVNGTLTSTPGTHRQYVSHGLVRGYEYTYEIQAVVNRGGRLVTDKHVVHLRAGETRDLAMNLDRGPAPTAIATSLTIHVPEDARVQLEGRATKATGAVRHFSTTGLAKGQQWDGYRIVVTLDHDGRPVTQEKTLRMVGGEAHEVRFEFDADLLASR